MGYKPTVLICDDSEAFLMYLSIVITRLGFDVVPVASGSDAIKMARVLNPDLVLLDVVMPEMDGIEALRHFKNDGQLSAIPVVMLSSVNLEEKIRQCRDQGCSGYITKPLKLQELHNALNKNITFPNFRSRKFLRCTYSEKVRIVVGGTEEEHYSETLSERGIYIRSGKPMEVGEEVTVKLNLEKDEVISIGGTIIYKKGIQGDVFRKAPGVAILFKELSTYEAMVIRDFIMEQLLGDVLDEQKEKVFEGKKD